MSHSAEQCRKKEEAMREAKSHMNSNLLHPRDGSDHETHKSKQMHEDSRGSY